MYPMNNSRKRERYEGEHAVNAVIHGFHVDRSFPNANVRYEGNGWFHVMHWDWVDSVTDDDYLWNARTDEARYIQGRRQGWATGDAQPHVRTDGPSWALRYALFDADLNMITSFVFNMLNPIDEHFIARQGRYGGLIGADGQWIVRVLLARNFD